MIDLSKYNTSQLLKVADKLLFRSILPIIRTNSFVDQFLSSILSYGVENPRRKLTSLQRDKWISLCFLFLLANKREKEKIYPILRIERSATYFIVQIFNEYAQEYTELEKALVASKMDNTKYNDQIKHRMKKIRDTLGSTSSISATYKQTKFWLTKYCEYRGMILNRYGEYIVGVSKLYAHDKPGIDAEDVAQNAALFAAKAIDKCDVNKGSLTSYIQTWVKKALLDPKYPHQYGIAYDIPANFRKKIVDAHETPNFIINLEDTDDVCQDDSVNVEEDIDREIEINAVRKLAKIADPEGYARIFLGIEETLDTPMMHKEMS